MFTKKFIVSILIFVMTVSIGNAFAQDFPEINSAITEKAVTELNSLGIMVGDTNGDFRGEATITRAEFSVILCRIKGIEDVAENFLGQASFADITNHWAKNYIETARLNGYINGFPDFTFHPDESVTVAQAVKMLVCLLGYDDSTLKSSGFPYGYTQKGESIGLVNGADLYPHYLDAKQGFSATRNFVAFLIANALDIPLRDWVSIDDTGRPQYEIFDGTGEYEYTTLRTETYGDYATSTPAINSAPVSSGYDSSIIEGIFVTPTGKRYHHLVSCAGKNAIETTLEKALAQGKTPCQTCVE